MARFPFLNADGTFQSAQVKTQLDARTDARMRGQLPALAEELGIGTTGVPIFATRAEAEAWEAAHPGKKALTLEPSTPDTTAPAWSATLTAGDASGGSVVLTASALATDDRAVARYEVTTNGGTSWATIVPQGKQFTVSGLTGGRTYTGIKLRAVDAAGNASGPLAAPSVAVPLEGPKDYAYLWDAADATTSSWVDRKAGVSLTKDGPGNITADGTMVAFPKPAAGTTTRTLARYKNTGITLTKSPTFTVVARAYQPGVFRFQFLMGNGLTAPVLPNGGASGTTIGNIAGGAPFRADDWQVYTFRYPAEGTTTGAITSGTVTASQTGITSKNWGAEVANAFHIGSPHYDPSFAFIGDIKEVQVFDRTLTDDEVAALHANLAKKHGVTL